MVDVDMSSAAGRNSVSADINKNIAVNLLDSYTVVEINTVSAAVFEKVFYVVNQIVSDNV